MNKYRYSIALIVLFFIGISVPKYLGKTSSSDDAYAMEFLENIWSKK